ncbi:MAG: helix-turn-helix domain-containing protein [Burkholderiales bacterium]
MLIIEVPIHIVPMIVRAKLDPLTTVLPPLSTRERQVLEGILEQLGNKQIGGRLHLAERTVKFHVSNLLAKFAVTTRHELRELFPLDKQGEKG